jgi:nitroreductase
MKFKKLLHQRFSVRSYKQEAVEHEKLFQVLEAGRMAPSAVNYQPWHFIVIDDPEMLNNIYHCYKGEWIQEAPLIIVACSDHTQSWKRRIDGKDSADIDVSIAADHMTLMAAELGLGTCWVCNFDPNRCSQFLKLPRNIEPVALLPLGYPKSEVPEKQRKDLNEIIHRNEFGKPFS